MGLPTVVIASEHFEELAHNAAQALGLPEARIYTVAHPIGGVAEDILRRRAQAGAREMMRQLQPELAAEEGNDG